MIPKIIHQTWKTKDIPDNWKNAVDSCKKINEDFQYILWTHETMNIFVKNNYPHFHKIYESYKYDIQRCDAFRYLVLYKYGGVYLDLDTVCNTNLNNFLNYDLVLAHQTNIKSSFTNAFFMVISNHPFFKYCIDNLSDNINNYQHFGKHLHVMNSTGPFFLNKMIKNYGKINNTYVLTKKEYAGDCNSCNLNICKGGQYFTHIQGKSWHEMDSTIYNYVYCHRESIIEGLICVIIILLLLKNRHKLFIRLLN